MNRIFYIAFFSLLLFSCGRDEEPKKEPVAEKPAAAETAPKIELLPTTFGALGNWKHDNLSQAVRAFADSCAKISGEKNQYLSNAAIKIPTADYQAVCRDFAVRDIHTSADFRRFVENNFIPNLVVENGNEIGKFTSYYESSLNASYHKNDRYKYPIYGRPNDLIEFNLRDFDENQAPKRYVGRIAGQKLVPYYTRAEIEAGAGDAPVLLWGDDPVDIYVMQIQGSAVADLDNGRKVRIGYADNNGHAFKGIGSILLSKGLIKPGEASMGKIKQWLKKNGQLALDNMAENKRFVFHRLVDAEGPVGAQGVPLRAGRSLAVDRRYIPLGSLLWLETTGPDREKIEKLVVAQDIGGAIKGAVRGDYFWGSGKDDVLDYAGRMNSAGRYFIMLPKNTETRN